MAWNFFVHRITSERGFAKPMSERLDTLSIVGPFKTGAEAADWGATYCAPGGPDDPRWNVVQLDLDGIEPLIIPMTWPSGSVRKDAYKTLNA
jgi:hypothetical protein